MPMTFVRISNNMTSRAIWRYQLSVNFSKTTKLHKSVRRVQFVAKKYLVKKEAKPRDNFCLRDHNLFYAIIPFLQGQCSWRKRGKVTDGLK